MKNFGESVWVCLSNYWWLLIFVLVVGFVLGYFISKKKADDFRKKLKKRIENLENWIMMFSFAIAVFCMYKAVSGVATEIDTQYLSLYSSFIFAWILTKKTASKDFKRNQHKIAKSTYRHIEDAETAVLIAKSRLMNNRGRALNEGDVEGLIDDLQIILTCIRSNKKDWRDMLKSSYKEKIDIEENPEDILEREYYGKVEPEDIKETFENEIMEANASGANSGQT